MRMRQRATASTSGRRARENCGAKDDEQREEMYSAATPVAHAGVARCCERAENATIKATRGARTMIAPTSWRRRRSIASMTSRPTTTASALARLEVSEIAAASGASEAAASARSDCAAARTVKATESIAAEPSEDAERVRVPERPEQQVHLELVGSKLRREQVPRERVDDDDADSAPDGCDEVGRRTARAEEQERAAAATYTRSRRTSKADSRAIERPEDRRARSRQKPTRAGRATQARSRSGSRGKPSRSATAISHSNPTVAAVQEPGKKLRFARAVPTRTTKSRATQSVTRSRRDARDVANEVRVCRIVHGRNARTIAG